MSRAYRVRVRESVRRVVRAEDHVTTSLELLEILPKEELAELLRAELVGRGFRAEGEALIRRGDGLTIAVDPASATVTVRAESAEEVELAAERQGYADTDWGPDGKKRAESALRERCARTLEAKAGRGRPPRPRRRRPTASKGRLGRPPRRARPGRQPRHGRGAQAQGGPARPDQGDDRGPRGRVLDDRPGSMNIGSRPKHPCPCSSPNRSYRRS